MKRIIMIEIKKKKLLNQTFSFALHRILLKKKRESEWKSFFLFISSASACFLNFYLFSSKWLKVKQIRRFNFFFFFEEMNEKHNEIIFIWISMHNCIWDNYLKVLPEIIENKNKIVFYEMVIKWNLIWDRL